MTQVVETHLVVTSTGTTYTIPGDWAVQALKDNYSASISGLASMVATERTESRSDGNLNKIVTFSPRTGNKG
jgi:hypothetical protein